MSTTACCKYSSPMKFEPEGVTILNETQLLPNFFHSLGIEQELLSTETQGERARFAQVKMTKKTIDFFTECSKAPGFNWALTPRAGSKYITTVAKSGSKCIHCSSKSRWVSSHAVNASRATRLTKAPTLALLRTGTWLINSSFAEEHCSTPASIRGLSSTLDPS